MHPWANSVNQGRTSACHLRSADSSPGRFSCEVQIPRDDSSYHQLLVDRSVGPLLVHVTRRSCSLESIGWLDARLKALYTRCMGRPPVCWYRRSVSLLFRIDDASDPGFTVDADADATLLDRTAGRAGQHQTAKTDHISHFSCVLRLMLR